MAWLRSKKLNQDYMRYGILSSLDRFVREHPIREPMDMVRIFSGVTSGQQHNLIPAVRALLNFANLKGYDKTWIDALKQAIPKDEERIDLKVPLDEQIVTSLRLMEEEDSIRYKAAYNLTLDSGLRLTEVVKLIKNFTHSEAQSIRGYHMVPIGMFRRAKLAYYGFFTDHTMKLISQLSEEDIASLGDRAASKYVYRRPNVIAYKYLRKFAFDKMIDLEIPESVADFIQGRTPKSVGAKHYMALARQASKFYPRYAEYITELRQKALN